MFIYNTYMYLCFPSHWSLVEPKTPNANDYIPPVESSTYYKIWVRDAYIVYYKLSSHLYTARHLHTVTYGFVTYGFVTHIMYMTSSQVICIPQVVYIP